MASEAAIRIAESVYYADDLNVSTIANALDAFAKRAVKGAFQAAPQALPWSRTKQGAEDELSKFADEVINGLT